MITTEKEMAFLRCRCSGMSDVETGKQFGVTRASVNDVLNRVYRRVGAADMTAKSSFACYILGRIDERKKRDMSATTESALLQ